MKPILIAFCAALAVSACATYGDYDDYYDGDGFNAYYDDAYGPFYDGYWRGGHFFYSSGRGHPFVRDDGGHFQRTAGGGMHGVHGGHGHAGGGGGGRR